MIEHARYFWAEALTHLRTVVGMMVESADTTDFYWSRGMGNCSRDALKVGEPSAHFGRGDTEPSFGNGEGVETGRARPTS